MKLHCVSSDTDLVLALQNKLQQEFNHFLHLMRASSRALEAVSVLVEMSLIIVPVASMSIDDTRLLEISVRFLVYSVSSCSWSVFSA